MVVIDIIIATQIESTTHIPGTNPEMQKTHTAHTANTKEDHITEDNKPIKTRIIFLRRDPKFTPTSKGNSFNLKSDICDFTRHIHMQEIFYGQDYQNESLISNKSNKQFKSKDLELQHLVKSIENIETEYKPFNSNISKDEQEALQKLRTNKGIIIKPTDKDGSLVLMDKTYYRDHLVNKEHLNSKLCKEIPLDTDKIVYKQLLLLVEKY